MSAGLENAGKGHVLLITPLSFSYHLVISNALQSMGFEVTWWDDRASASTWYKIILRLFPLITVRWSQHVFLKKLSALTVSCVTHVVVVKGEGLSATTLLEMRQRMSAASFGLYLWDGVENIKNVLNIASIFDSVATFDPVDAEKFHWTYRPLFGRKSKALKPGSSFFDFDWCFIGTIHSDRHLVIHRLRRRYRAQLKSFVFAFFQNWLVLWLRLMCDWTLWVAPKGTFSTRSMSADDINDVVVRSRSVLDIEHPKQRGYTMRTIETLLAEKKLVTTNRHILSSNLYHPSRVHIIDRLRPEIPESFLASPYLPVAATLCAYYSCVGWAKELLELQDKAFEIRHSTIRGDK